MIIRIIQLKNNFYRDGKLPDHYPRTKELGPFCVLGYFDALDTQRLDEDELKTWDSLSKISVTQLDGVANLRTLVCFCPEQEVVEGRDCEADFWMDNDALPFYFISMIRVDRNKVNNLMYQIKKINIEEKDRKLFAYLTYDHSEVIVVSKTRQYSKGFQTISELREKLCAFKIYTIFSVRESLLSSQVDIKRNIRDELVQCRLKIVVKEFKSIEIFILSLMCQLRKSSSKAKIKSYDTLGSGDILLEISDVWLSSILECYRMGNILSHTHELFEEAFFNIETEILVKRQKGDVVEWIDGLLDKWRK